MLGRQPRSRILEEVKKGGIVVVPSLYESFAITVIEAMACGTPVIASDLAALRETIRSEDKGLLFQAGDPDALADQVVRVMTDQTEWNRLSLGGVNRSRFRAAGCCRSIVRRLGLSNGQANV